MPEFGQASGKSKVVPLLPAKKTDYGMPRSLLFNGSRFVGSQKSKGNCYDVEVVLQVRTVISLESSNDLFLARGRGKRVLMWVFDDQRSHRRLSSFDYVLSWRNHWQEASVFDEEVGR